MPAIKNVTRAEEEEAVTGFRPAALDLEAVADARSRHAQSDLLRAQLEEEMRAQARLVLPELDPEKAYQMWRRLPEAERREQMKDGFVQDARPEDAKEPLRPGSSNLSDLQQAFSSKTRGMITRDAMKDWRVVCDPVKTDPRWGRYTPGVSRMTQVSAVKKTDPRLYDPPFTLEPVADFAPDPTVLCTMHQADMTLCGKYFYPNKDNPAVSTELVAHQRYVHPGEVQARDLQQQYDQREAERDESRADREERAAMLNTLVEMQRQNKALVEALAARSAEPAKEG